MHERKMFFEMSQIANMGDDSLTFIDVPSNNTLIFFQNVQCV